MYFHEFIKQIDTLRIFKHKTINKIVISALKCGNRFMEESDCFELIPLANITLNDFKNIDAIYWIIRDPEQHFISALITELQVKYNSLQNTYDNEEDWIYSLIETKLSEILEEPILTLNFSHYQPRYEYLISMLKDEVRYFYNSKFIELKNLSKLVESEFDCKYQYVEEKYSLDFGGEYVINKAKLLKLLETRFKSKWNKIKKIIIKETIYYNELGNINFLNYFIEKIDRLDSDIKEQININNAALLKIEKIEYNNLQKMIAKDKILLELNTKLGYIKKTFI